MFQHTSQDNLTGQVYNDLRQRLNECGIGFTGIDGVWWRPACEPFELSIGLAQQLGEKDLVVLDRCLPLTILLTGESFNRVFDEQDDWVVKYAAYDGANQTGGGQSLEIGRQHTRDMWHKVLERCLASPWPVVAQRAVPPAREGLHHLDARDKIVRLADGHTRLRTFFIRDDRESLSSSRRSIACGSHITVSEGSAAVAEGLNAVQAPAVFV